MGKIKPLVLNESADEKFVKLLKQKRYLVGR